MMAVSRTAAKAVLYSILISVVFVLLVSCEQLYTSLLPDIETDEDGLPVALHTPEATDTGNIEDNEADIGDDSGDNRTDEPADTTKPNDGSDDKPNDRPSDSSGQPADTPAPTKTPDITPKPTLAPTPAPTQKPGASTPSEEAVSLLGLKYYRSKLNSSDRKVYDAIYAAADAFMDSIDLSEYKVMKGRLLDIYDLYQFDSPEHFWQGNIEFTYDPTNDIVAVVNFNYSMTSKQKTEFQSKVESEAEGIIKGIGKNRTLYDKIKYIHDYIILSNVYDSSAKYNQTIVSTLLYNKSVCAGYAKTMQYLLNKIGIECIYVTGISRNQNHAWNIVNIDSKYYNLDATWDDPVFDSSETHVDTTRYINYNYFLVTDEQISKDHIRDAVSAVMPQCTSNDMTYYVKEGLQYDRLDANTISSLADKLYARINDRPQVFSFRFTNKQAKDNYMNSLIDTWGQVVDIVNSKCGNMIETSSFSYMITDEKNNTIEMIIKYN